MTPLTAKYKAKLQRAIWIQQGKMKIQSNHRRDILNHTIGV